MRDRVAVIGAGPAGLIAAETLAASGCVVEVFDRMPSPARKFLIAGRGGLNLTHSEPLAALLDRYAEARARLAPAIEAFPPERLRGWCEALGEPTFIGSSGRVFPRAMKASPLLRAWLRRLAALGVVFRPRHRWVGWREGALTFDTPSGSTRDVRADATVLALGGASWPRLGADGTWTALLDDVAPLRPSNCGFTVPWSPHMARFAGTPLKRIALTHAGRTARGEAVVTASGVEGGAVYALSGRIRDACPTTIAIDLRPDLTLADLASRLDRPRAGQSLSNALRRWAGLEPVGIALIQEVAHGAAGVPNDATELAALVKAVPLRCLAPASIDRAISSAGGLRWDALDPTFMLRARPGVFAAGEMLDWEAPTGGYLLQACFATGVAAAHGALAWLASRREERS